MDVAQPEGADPLDEKTRAFLEGVGCVVPGCDAVADHLEGVDVVVPGEAREALTTVDELAPGEEGRGRAVDEDERNAAAAALPWRVVIHELVLLFPVTEVRSEAFPGELPHLCVLGERTKSLLELGLRERAAAARHTHDEEGQEAQYE